jgi:enoyl-CoA hydratase/carnithine racemase
MRPDCTISIRETNGQALGARFHTFAHAQTSDRRPRALHLILSGEMIGAQEAYRIGLVNEVVPAADLITRADAILKKIASNAPIAVKLALEAANMGIDTSQGEGLLLEASYFGLYAATEEKKEGTSAFLEKRAPKFQGR